MRKTLRDSLNEYEDDGGETVKKGTSRIEKLMLWKDGKFRDSLSLKSLDYSKTDKFNVSNRGYYERVILLHQIGGVPLKYFDFELNRNLENVLKRQGQSRDSKDDNHYVPLASFSDKNTPDFQDKMASNYLSESEFFLNNIKKKLYVYDYLDRFNQGIEKTRQKYTEKHNDIYKDIEKILKSSKGDHNLPSINYARFLSLPKSISYEGSDLVGLKLVRENIKNC